MSESDEALAARLAEAAMNAALAIRAEGRLEGRALGDAADSAANRLIMDGLRRDRPGDGLLSEESPDNAERLAPKRVWIVHPLARTRQYAAGRDDWAVHVALAVEGRARLGAVLLPG